MNPDLIGWTASLILFATLLTQIRKQWKEETSKGVSAWLFVGQIAASTGFLAYSLMLKNWVFVTTNALLLGTAVFGEIIYLRNRRRRPGKVDFAQPSALIASLATTPSASKTDWARSASEPVQERTLP